MKKILFADLDDTLFQSHRKAPPAANWRPAAFLSDGSTISYATPQQQAMLQALQQDMTLIPVTARNHDAFRRVAIAFHAEAVLNYGGIILNADQQPDETWLARSQQHSRQSLDDLQRWVARLEADNARLGLDVRVRLIADFDLPFYVVGKSRSGDPGAVAALAAACREWLATEDPPGTTLHVNHNNLALIPAWLDKQHAVDHLRQRYAATCPELLTFGMGDSVVDLNFMHRCDYLIVPAGSQIAQQRMGGSA